MPIGIENSFPLLDGFLVSTGEILENRVKFLATGEKSGAEAYIATAGDSRKFDTFLWFLNCRGSCKFCVGYLLQNPLVRRIEAIHSWLELICYHLLSFSPLKHFGFVVEKIQLIKPQYRSISLPYWQRNIQKFTWNTFSFIWFIWRKLYFKKGIKYEKSYMQSARKEVLLK